MSVSVPSSLLTSMSETRPVSGVSAAATAPAVISPCASGASRVTAMPRASRLVIVSRMALCSSWLVMRWRFCVARSA